MNREADRMYLQLEVKQGKEGKAAPVTGRGGP
jgi:hypothetical protein